MWRRGACSAACLLACPLPTAPAAVTLPQTSCCTAPPPPPPLSLPLLAPALALHVREPLHRLRLN